MERIAIFNCFMCFVSGACLTALFLACCCNRDKRVLTGWAVYLAIVLVLAYRVGGALIL